MNLNILKPRKALNKAFLKVGPRREDIEKFKGNLIALLEQSNHTESEEHHKNLVIDFLKKTYYDPNHFVNTKGRQDLVIHNGKDAKSNVGVIIEAKKPSSKTEMLTKANVNKKALQELVLYFLRERITGNNLEVKHLVVTNTFEWFIFDATLFDKLFVQNKEFVKQFTDFEEGRLSDTKTDFFYKSIVEPFVAKIESEIVFTYFDIREYDKALKNEDKKDDNQLVALFKILSPEHLLKLPFTNDSNSLDKPFYNELLHIIGLTESKDGGKKLIGRKKEGERNTGSLLENAIIQLDDLDKLSRLQTPSQFGETHEQRLFNVGLELAITWVNRILFLKLLEAQLIAYHKGDKSHAFLNSDRIKSYDDLNSLFFAVLAKKPQERNEDVKKAFAKVPYLNSSLFEMSGIEHDTIAISNLRDEKALPILSSTVLKDNNGKKRTGELSALAYFFEFLNAYDFSSEGSEEIQEENKQLINASVLGLIFEKINGYKDGSFFTPGFITMYMCRETIRRAVLQKFKEAKGWECETIDQLYDKIEDRKEANALINSLKICDPAVGSGHFLVSALNEIIAIKSDLKILSAREGKRLKEYVVEVVNDELIVTDEDGELFEYVHTKKESQRIQETLFHEKQTIIENCLFGVDINPNSVKICRLRLWIELLKNAYYTDGLTGMELETLPNIDINIKCGNSLISRFALDADLKQALKSSKSKWNIESYKLAVSSYRDAKSKEEKRSMEALINEIKGNFRSEISKNDPKLSKLYKLKGELVALTTQTAIFGMSDKEKKKFEKDVEAKTNEIDKLETEIEEIKSNRIYENAFEWRFEFPEVLSDEGDFIGFDVVIGNPPYIPGKSLEVIIKEYLKNNYNSSVGKFDLYVSFIELGQKIANESKNLSFIIPNTFLANENAIYIRKYLIKYRLLDILVVLDDSVFEEASVESIILMLNKINENDNISLVDKQFKLIGKVSSSKLLESEDSRIQVSIDSSELDIISKIQSNSIYLENVIDFCIGIQIGGHGDSKDFKEKYLSNKKIDETYKIVIDGKDFDNYKINKTDKFVKYGNWLHRKRDEKYFLNPKILIRQIGATPFACLDYEKFYTLNTIYNGILIDSNYDLNFVFAIINSKPTRFFWKTMYSDGKTIFPKVKKSQLDKIPIPICSSENQQVICEIVLSILKGKKVNSQSDVSKLENEIDHLIYKIYDLTKDEIKIIEGIS